MSVNITRTNTNNFCDIFNIIFFFSRQTSQSSPTIEIIQNHVLFPLSLLKQNRVQTNRERQKKNILSSRLFLLIITEYCNVYNMFCVVYFCYDIVDCMALDEFNGSDKSQLIWYRLVDLSRPTIGWGANEFSSQPVLIVFRCSKNLVYSTVYLHLLCAWNQVDTTKNVHRNHNFVSIHLLNNNRIHLSFYSLISVNQKKNQYLYSKHINFVWLFA